MNQTNGKASGLIRDPWSALRATTAARVALGRAGGSLPSGELLTFSLDHAEARDAVHSSLDVERLTASLEGLGLPILKLSSQASDRQTYLKRPDLGRRLNEESSRALRDSPQGRDLVLIVADGLSALAAQLHAAGVVKGLVERLTDAGVTLAPVCVVTQARVGIQDEIGAALGARAALILLGERPGLGTPDSLGAYLVFDPKLGNTDADRNCVSNIRPAGLPIDSACDTIAYLVTESLRRRISGVHLKDDRPALGAPQSLQIASS